MAVLSPPFALGATGQLLSGRLLRLSQGATWRPAAAALAAVSGAVAGPPGSMGEATLVNPTTLRVGPGVFVVQGTHSGDQGQYVVPNDAPLDLPITGQHASQFRRSVWGIAVADSQAAGVASSATTDRAYLALVDGPLSAQAPGPLPPLPANFLALGEVAVPPVGQTVTITPYNPRTITRGGILPVFADTSTVPGHGGAAGTYLGEPRYHPSLGLQLWTGAVWAPPDPAGPMVLLRRGAAQSIPNATWTLVSWDIQDGDISDMWPFTAGQVAGNVTIRRTGWYQVDAQVSWAGAVAAGRIGVRVMRAGAPVGIGAMTASGNAFEPSVGASGLVFYTEGQLASVQAYQDSGAARNTASPDWASTHLSMMWVRP